MSGPQQCLESTSASFPEASLRALEGPFLEAAEKPLWEVLESLLRMHFSEPAVNRRSSIFGGVTSEAQYFNVGAFSVGDNFGITRLSYKVSGILHELNNLLKKCFPGRTWSAICINHNEPVGIHCDVNNEPGSLNCTLALGSFSGGELWLEDSMGSLVRTLPSGKEARGRLCTTLKSPFCFDASRFHQVEPWQGDRWSIICYTTRCLDSLDPVLLSELREWGFPLPGDSLEHAFPQETNPSAREDPRPAKLAFLVGALASSELSPRCISSSIPHLLLPVHDVWPKGQLRDWLLRATFEGVVGFLFIDTCTLGIEQCIFALQLACAMVVLQMMRDSCIWNLPLFQHFSSTVGTCFLHVPPLPSLQPAFYCTNWHSLLHWVQEQHQTSSPYVHFIACTALDCGNDFCCMDKGTLCWAECLVSPEGGQ